jgi:DNA modification methylase
MGFHRNSRTVQLVSINTLHLPTRQVQWNPKKQVEKATKFLAEFGQTALVYAAPDGEILCGEEFWLALKASGAAEIDVVFINDKSPVELKAIRLALHRIPEDARWNDQNVRVVLEEIETSGIDLDLTGFDPPEIDNYLNLDLPSSNVAETCADIPTVEKHGVSTLGLIWRLGEHQLGCGSATNLEFVRRVFGDQPVNMSFIDPPYNIPVHGFISGKGRNRHREFVQGSGELTDDQYFLLLRDAFAVLQSLSSANALIFSCIDWRHALEMLVAARACGLSLYQIIAWIKANGGMGGIYRNQHELICVFRAGQESPLDNVELGKRGRNRTNVWQHYGGMSSFGKGRDELLELHPTVKPVAMIADALRDCTKRRHVVADTFAGSGSTLMAAEETGRHFRGVELDPLYVDVAVRRWQNLTGREAVSLATGEPFNSVRQRLLPPPMEPGHGS